MSIFLTIEDYQTRIRTNRRNQLLDDDDTIADEAEKDSMAIVEEYLASRFDLNYEFSKAGDNRNKALVRWVGNIAIYFLYQRTPEDFMPEYVMNDYRDTLSTLQKIAKGEIPTTLKIRQYDIDGDGIFENRTKIRMGSSKPRSH